MRKCLLLLVVALPFSTIATARQNTEQGRTAAPEFTTTATIKDIMVSMVDPSADFMWNSVATNISPAGVQENVPRTQKDWAAVRRSTITLLESTNLLMMPGRRVAGPGDKSGNPNIELSPEQIELLLSKDRESWNKLARGLYDATLAALRAVDAKDAEGLLIAGSGIDNACESCHKMYWYPTAGK